MKNLKLIVFILATVLFILSPAVNAIQAITHLTHGEASLLLIPIVVVLCLIPTKSRNVYTHTAGVEKEIWVNYIIQRYYKDNQFLNFAFPDDQYVLGGSVVHIPQKGAKPTVVKNRNAYPAVAVQRGDNDVTYVLDNYSTDPTQITTAEQSVITYDKMDDVLGDHIGQLAETVADDMLYKWATGIPNFIFTSGGPTAITADATLDGSAGQVLTAFHKDIRRVNLAMNKQNAPKTDRYGLLDEDMADQIFDSLSDTQQRTFTEYADATTGVLGKLYGFNIMTRSSVLAASAANAISAPGAVVQPTDVAGSFFWQKNSVARALGLVKIYDDTDNPLYYGNVVSTEVRAGGRRRRSDNIGVIALLQGRPNA